MRPSDMARFSVETRCDFDATVITSRGHRLIFQAQRVRDRGGAVRQWSVRVPGAQLGQPQPAADLRTEHVEWLIISLIRFRYIRLLIFFVLLRPTYRVLRYECCEGFKSTNNGRSACTGGKYKYNRYYVISRISVIVLFRV